jgi:NitT/TauT family transport system substrate-binding protein
LVTAAVSTLALVALAFGRGWTADPVGSRHGRPELRLAFFPNITHAPALVGVEKGFFQRDLPAYSITTRVVNAGPEAMEALLAGEVDLAYVGPSPATNTFLKSNGEALRIVAGACSGGASLVARKDVEISSVRELDGHSVAVPQLGGTQDVSCRHFLAVNGLKPLEQGGTVSIVPVKNPDILALFLRKQIDAAWVPEPWASRLKDEAGAKTVIDERQLWPGGKFSTTVLVARRAYAVAHPDAVRAFIRSHSATIAWMRGHEDEAEQAANQELKRLTGKELKPRVLAAAWSHVDFTDDPLPDTIVAFANAAYDAGYLKSKPGRLSGLIDTHNLVAVDDARRKPGR